MRGSNQRRRGIVKGRDGETSSRRVANRWRSQQDLGSKGPRDLRHDVGIVQRGAKTATTDAEIRITTERL